MLDSVDTLDDAFWMLSFSSKKQAHIILQDNQITDEEWQERRDLITAEHRLPAAKEQLEQHSKAWIAQGAFKARRAAPRRQPVLRLQLRRFRNTTRSSLLLYHLLLSMRHFPIHTPMSDVLAKRCSSWRRGIKFESVFSEMQDKIQKKTEELRTD
jgi:hypothetical protein